MGSDWPLLYQGQQSRDRGKQTLGVFELYLKARKRNIFMIVEEHKVPGGLESPDGCSREASRGTGQSCYRELDAGRGEMGLPVLNINSGD